jgi:DNA invertase Pin-like site-specific DNA recombinase
MIRARGVVLGRQEGQRPSDKKAKRVLSMHKEGLSYRLIGRNLGLSKNTVMEIVKRENPNCGKATIPGAWIDSDVRC